MKDWLHLERRTVGHPHQLHGGRNFSGSRLEITCANFCVGSRYGVSFSVRQYAAASEGFVMRALGVALPTRANGIRFARIHSCVMHAISSEFVTGPGAETTYMRRFQLFHMSSGFDSCH